MSFLIFNLFFTTIFMKAQDLHLGLVFLIIHFYHYLSLLLWVKSSYKILVVWPNTYISSRSMGDICKFKQHFWTLHNSFFYKLYLKQMANRSCIQILIVCDILSYKMHLESLHAKIEDRYESGY